MAKNSLDAADVWTQARRFKDEGKTLKEAARELNLRADTLMALLYRAVTQGKPVVQFADASRKKSRRATPANLSQLIVYRPGRANRDVKRLTVPEPLLDQWGIQAGETVQWTVNKKGELIGSLIRNEPS
jgi:hypothetical protein